MQGVFRVNGHPALPISRPTILHETQDFVEEPASIPVTPAQTVGFIPSARLPGSRRATEYNYPPYPYPPYVGNGHNHNDPDTQRKWTQEDQDQYDEKVRKKAMDELVQSWMDRLQLISVITTFFAAIEAQLLGITTPDSADSDPRVDQAANATLAGALVVHVFAAIMSFFAAFFLIRYKLSMAKREEHKVQISDNKGGVDTVSSSSIWSSNPHLKQVGPFRRGQPPTHLLDHLHSLCLGLSATGFILSLVGVMCFVWSRLARSAGAFASVCMGACLISGVAAVFWPPSSMHRKPKTA
ncbi:hypothetical protein L226DRAFT_165071 [Lentinus tigrinus ALCF2SS1-7]|uniref:Uncharacterized protein n=1 Tax=Lentinus tigrinus ALCF2SS1-6 TaxID=1328759 RepID=A0A5C2S2R4_9APHY|nr:hypothetical protein L227DRAFT_222057 [Lentinus tigrinus ALCF2SS1-6]RPD71913.1 hypothetical protein L226DRAFT_165071 [Lentinus tigrinus ALCF2SS1-7]